MTSTQTKVDKNFEFGRAYVRFFNPEVELKVIEELVKNYKVHFKSKSQDLDSTDGILDTVSKLPESVQEEFENLIGADSDKKNLIRSISKVISILLSERYNTVEKMTKLIRIAIETTLTAWLEPRQQ